MGLIRAIRRGATRAAFEADRLMRVNRARAEITALNSRIDEEHGLIGSRIVDLYQAGLLQHQELEPACQRVLQLRADAREKAADLSAILEEAVPGDAAAGQSS